MMRTIIAVPLYRRSRPQGVSGACCGKASYYLERESSYRQSSPSSPSTKDFYWTAKWEILGKFSLRLYNCLIISNLSKSHDKPCEISKPKLLLWNQTFVCIMVLASVILFTGVKVLSSVLVSTCISTNQGGFQTPPQTALISPFLIRTSRNWVFPGK